VVVHSAQLLLFNVTEWDATVTSIMLTAHLGDMIVDKLVSVARNRFTVAWPLRLSCILITVHTRPATTTKSNNI